MKPKILEGQALTGTMFAELAEHYVTTMNSDAVPTISTAWERVIDKEIERIYESAVSELEDYVNNVIATRLPLELSEMKLHIKEAKKRSISILNSMTIANAPPEKLIDLKE